MHQTYKDHVRQRANLDVINSKHITCVNAFWSRTKILYLCKVAEVNQRTVKFLNLLTIHNKLFE
jgi:hypothetical protein